jgi:hypothetical protein
MVNYEWFVVTAAQVFAVQMVENFVGKVSEEGGVGWGSIPPSPLQQFQRWLAIAVLVRFVELAN